MSVRLAPENVVQLVRVARCRVCTSDHRRDVERLVLDGVHPAKVIEQLADGCLNPRNVVEHVRRGHLGVDHAAVRAHIAARTLQIDAAIRRAATEGRIEEVDRALFDLAAGHLRLRRGELTVTLDQALRAMKLLSQLDSVEHRVQAVRSAAQALDRERLRSLLAVFDIVEATTDETTFGRILNKIMLSDAAHTLLMTPLLTHLRDHPAREVARSGTPIAQRRRREVRTDGVGGRRGNADGRTDAA